MKTKSTIPYKLTSRNLDFSEFLTFFSGMDWTRFLNVHCNLAIKILTLWFPNSYWFSLSIQSYSSILDWFNHWVPLTNWLIGLDICKIQCFKIIIHYVGHNFNLDDTPPPNHGPPFDDRKELLVIHWIDTIKNTFHFVEEMYFHFILWWNKQP